MDTGSASATRFMIVFNNNSPLTLNGLQIKATIKNKQAIIAYNVTTEKEVDHYVVERSKDAKTFVALTTQVANNVDNSQYNYTDKEALDGVNYYRIKAINKDRSIQYSTVAKVIMDERKEGISVYPNPVAGKELNIFLSNIAAGNFTIDMYNLTGQQIMSENIVHSGGSMTSKLPLPSNISSGIYQLKLSGNGNTFVETVIVK